MNNINLSHSADSVVFYQVKLKSWLIPACPATGASLNSKISRLARLDRANNEGADQTAPMGGSFALCFSHPTTSHFLHVGSFSLHATQILVFEAL